MSGKIDVIREHNSLEIVQEHNTLTVEAIDIYTEYVFLADYHSIMIPGEV